ncbi:MAG: hypothetical protein AVDCRST_MAG79-2510, partial [uncultured Thermoleophilia bacterium]
AHLGGTGCARARRLGAPSGRPRRRRGGRRADHPSRRVRGLPDRGHRILADPVVAGRRSRDRDASRDPPPRLRGTRRACRHDERLRRQRCVAPRVGEARLRAERRGRARAAWGPTPAPQPAAHAGALGRAAPRRHPPSGRRRLPRPPRRL